MKYYDNQCSVLKADNIKANMNVSQLIGSHQFLLRYLHMEKTFNMYTVNLVCISLVLGSHPKL